MAKRRQLTGIWAAVHTPFRGDGALDEGALQGNLRHYRQSLGLSGVFCNGIMGEFWALTLDERRRIHDIVAGARATGLGTAILVNHHGLADTVRLARHAARAGNDYVAVMNPAVGPRADESLYRFFRTICDAVHVPVVLFNSPSSGYSMSARLIAGIALRGNVIAVKTTASRRSTNELRQLCPDLIVSDPLEAHWYDNMSRHQQPVLFADPEPYLFQTASSRPVAAYTEALRRGNAAVARRISARLGTIRKVYGKWIMRPLTDGRMPNAALKCWASLVGLAAGPVRPPLVDLPAHEARRLAAEVAAGLDAMRRASRALRR